MIVSHVIIRGRVERKEFQEPFRQCAEMLQQTGASYRVNPAAIEEPADFALFFQSYPHEFSRSELESLRQNYPFAPFFFVLGVCCEGLHRTAGSLDSPFYCYVHGWSGNEIEQISRFLTDQSSVFSLPLTAENDEIAQWQTRARAGGASPLVPQPAGLRPPLLVKCLILTQFGPFGNDSAMNLLLAEEQKRRGYEPLFSGKTLPESFSDIIFADADDSPREKILESIQRLRGQFADNEFTVYIDSPRIDEKTDYIQAGVTHVLPKIR